MNRLKPQRVPIIILIVAVLIFSGYLIINQVKSYLALSQSLQQMEAKLNQYATLQQSLVDEKERLVASKADWQQYNIFFNKELQKGELLMILGNQAINQRLTITNITPHEVTKTEHYQQLPLQMTIKGAYHDILLYLQWLENLAEWTNYSEIVAFSITPSEEAQTLSVVECNVTLALYTTPTPTKEMHNHGKNGGQ